MAEALAEKEANEDELHAELKELFSGAITEQIRLLGVRTAELHKALAARADVPAFAPEKYSLHYQRSLYAGFQSLVRTTFQDQNENLKRLDPEVRKEDSRRADEQTFSIK